MAKLIFGPIAAQCVSVEPASPAKALNWDQCRRIYEGLEGLSDSVGNILLTHTPDLEYEVVILSSPDLISGQSYTVTAGSLSQEVTAD